MAPTFPCSSRSSLITACSGWQLHAAAICSRVRPDQRRLPLDRHASHCYSRRPLALRDGRGHFLLQSLPQAGILQTRQQGRYSSRMGPLRNHRRQGGRGGGVGVLVGTDVNPRRASGRKSFQRCPPLAPVVAAECLQVGDLDAGSAFPADGDCFVQCGGKPVPLVTNVAGIDGIVACQNTCQGDQFAGVGIAPRRIDQPGRHSPRPLAEGFREKLLHPFEFGGCRRPVIHAQGGDPQRCMTYQRRQVDSGREPIQQLGIAGKVMPGKA